MAGMETESDNAGGTLALVAPVHRFRRMNDWKCRPAEPCGRESGRCAHRTSRRGARATAHRFGMDRKEPFGLIRIGHQRAFVLIAPVLPKIEPSRRLQDAADLGHHGRGFGMGHVHEAVHRVDGIERIRGKCNAATSITQAAKPFAWHRLTIAGDKSVQTTANPCCRATS